MKRLLLIGLFCITDNCLAQQAEVERIIEFIRNDKIDIARSQLNGSNNRTAVSRALVIRQNTALSEGISHYNEKDYEAALTRFKTSDAIARVLGVTDSLALFNAALSAEQLKDWNTAESYYKQCTDIGYKGGSTYYFLYAVQQQAGKQAEAMATLAEGRKKYPGDQSLLTTQLNQTLQEGDLNRAETLLREAIALDADNAMLHFTLGTVYDYLHQQEADRARFDGSYDPAERLKQIEAAYTQALTLDPNYFDARYNLGAFYFNRGVEQGNAAADLADPAQYKAEKAKADDLFRKALVALEKAQTLKPDDRNTLLSLSQIYARLGMTDKYREVSEKLK